MARANNRSLRPLRILLDQNFPKPPGFRLESVDRNISAEHLSDWRPDLSQTSTPDWMLYCEASMAGFHAMVSRDAAQVNQAAEMSCLNRLTNFHLVAWSKPVDDPVIEWGQLLAYLPQLRRFIDDEENHSSQVILLPKPTLTPSKNVHRPNFYLSKIATASRTTVKDIMSQGQVAMFEDEEILRAGDHRYTEFLKLRPNGS